MNKYVYLFCYTILVANCDCEPIGNSQTKIFSAHIPQNDLKQLDLLLVVSNSYSMADESEFCLNYLGVFESLAYELNGLNIHIGVTTADVGTGQHIIENCGVEFGDDGILGIVSGIDKTVLCLNSAARYIVDVEPVGCLITRDMDGICINHDCIQDDCIFISQQGENLTLSENQQGCPRCRNFDGLYLDDIANCLLGVGNSGCKFSQPLEAMYRALQNQQENLGFLRNEANLGIIIITDSDDCSARDNNIFNPAQDDIDSELGNLTAFRCFEFGVECDVNSRYEVGAREDCTARTDNGALLKPVTEYVQYLKSLKN